MLATIMRHGRYLLTFLLAQRLFWIFAMGTFPDTITVTLGATVAAFELLPSLILMFRDNTGAFEQQGGWKRTFWMLFVTAGSALIVYIVFLFPLAANGYTCTSDAKVPILAKVVNCGDWGKDGTGEEQSRTLFLYLLVAIGFHIVEMTVYSTGLRTAGTAWKMEPHDVRWLKENRDAVNVGAILLVFGTSIAVYLYDYNKVHEHSVSYILALLGSLAGGIILVFAVAFIIHKSRRADVLRTVTGQAALWGLVLVSLSMTAFILFIMVIMWEHAASCDGWNVGERIQEWGGHIYDAVPFLDQPCMDNLFKDYSHFWIPVLYYTLVGLLCIIVNVFAILILVNSAQFDADEERMPRNAAGARTMGDAMRPMDVEPFPGHGAASIPPRLSYFENDSGNYIAKKKARR